MTAYNMHPLDAPSRQPGLPLTEPPPPPHPLPTGGIHYSGYARQDRDFYATPAWVTEALLQHVRLRGKIWEPCCGDGAMSKILTAHGHHVHSSDIADRGFGTPGIDVLACRFMPENCQTIVTNPPYGDTGSQKGQPRSPSAMLDFLRHCMGLVATTQGQLALLVRLQWIVGRRAADLLSSGPFAATIVLTRRIQWFEMGQDTNTAQHHHAWVVLDHAHPGGTPPALHFA